MLAEQNILGYASYVHHVIEIKENNKKSEWQKDK